MTSPLPPVATALGMLHSVSDWPYSPCREMTVQAFGSLTPFTKAVFSDPGPMTWQVGEVQFKVSPQLFCAVAIVHKADHESNAMTILDFIGFISSSMEIELRLATSFEGIDNSIMEHLCGSGRQPKGRSLRKKLLSAAVLIVLALPPA